MDLTGNNPDDAIESWKDVPIVNSEGELTGQKWGDLYELDRVIFLHEDR